MRQGAVELSDDVDVKPAVAALARLPLASLAPVAVLEAVADIGAELLPAADAVFVRSIESGRADLTFGGSELATSLEDLQQQLAEGPALDVRQSAFALSGSLGGEARWPRFGPRAGRLGVHSALAVGLRHERTAIGAITFYSASRGAFASEEVRSVESFAGYAAVSMHNAQVFGRIARSAGILQAEAAKRATVERAVGILMSRRGVGPTEAMTALRELSQHENLKLVEVAQRLVDEAVRRARARIDAD